MTGTAADGPPSFFCGRREEVRVTGEQLGTALAELKAYLRIAGDDEDDVMAALLKSAAALCEQFLGQRLVVRETSETVPADGRWQRLAARPVVAISAVEGVSAEGQGAPIGAGAYAIDIDRNGEGWVRSRVAGVALLKVSYQAGLAVDLDGVPDAVRQGIVRLAADNHVARGGEAAAAPPAAITALWRPWRRMRLA